MKTNRVKAVVTPGRMIYRLTKKEVAFAVFLFAKGRSPTEEEVERLAINVFEDGVTREWELVLSAEDLPMV